MTANINDLIFEKLDPIYGPDKDVAELLIAWWNDEGDGSGDAEYPANDALYEFYATDVAAAVFENFADRQYEYWTDHA